MMSSSPPGSLSPSHSAAVAKGFSQKRHRRPGEAPPSWQAVGASQGDSPWDLLDIPSGFQRALLRLVPSPSRRAP